MNKTRLIVLFIFLVCINNCLSTLVDGIVTLSWSATEPVPIVDRFLTNNSQIQLKLICREPTVNASVVQQQIKKKTYKLNKQITNTNIKIRGRIGRIVSCLPLQSDVLLATNNQQQDKSNEKNLWLEYYNRLWKEMEQRTFVASQTDCDYTGTHVNIDSYSPIERPEISHQQAIQLRENSKNKKKGRRAIDDGISTNPGSLLTWGDGYYLIEIYAPEITNAENNPSLDVDVVLAMKNNRGGYITADEQSALVFYGIMCAIYALFAVLWFIWCAFYWKELLKIQFWIGGVILIGMIEKSAFLAEYDILNKDGYKVYYAIVLAEFFSCLKRTVCRMLVIIVALGYGIVKPRLGPLKQKVIAIGLIYFGIASTESFLRLNTKNDETNNKVLTSRIPLAIVDAIIYYWIFSGLVATTRQLRLKKNLVKLNVYRHFTNTILFAIIASLLFMIWSLKSHFFTACITNWREFWVEDEEKSSKNRNEILFCLG
mgnify:CR=1 FL=1